MDSIATKVNGQTNIDVSKLQHIEAAHISKKPRQNPQKKRLPRHHLK